MQRGFSMNSENSLKNSKTRYPEMVFVDNHYQKQKKQSPLAAGTHSPSFSSSSFHRVGHLAIRCLGDMRIDHRTGLALVRASPRLTQS
jgi:hypothetical protein